MKFCSLIILVSWSLVLSCTTEVSRPQPEPTISPAVVIPIPPAPPSDVQWEQWTTDSYKPVLTKWLNGENIDGKFITLDWKEEALDFVGPSQREARVTLLDINGDGLKEMAMQTACATVGNCVFLLFQRHGNGYREILNADMVQLFELRKSRSNGYFDLETSSHGSANSGGIAVYKFDGSQYKIAECFGYEYEMIGVDKNGQGITRKRPKLTPADCGSGGD